MPPGKRKEELKACRILWMQQHSWASVSTGGHQKINRSGNIYESWQDSILGRPNLGSTCTFQHAFTISTSCDISTFWKCITWKPKTSWKFWWSAGTKENAQNFNNKNSTIKKRLWERREKGIEKALAAEEHRETTKAYMLAKAGGNADSWFSEAWIEVYVHVCGLIFHSKIE